MRPYYRIESRGLDDGVLWLRILRTVFALFRDLSERFVDEHLGVISTKTFRCLLCCFFLFAIGSMFSLLVASQSPSQMVKGIIGMLDAVKLVGRNPVGKSLGQYPEGITGMLDVSKLAGPNAVAKELGRGSGALREALPIPRG